MNFKISLSFLLKISCWNFIEFIKPILGELTSLQLGLCKYEQCITLNLFKFPISILQWKLKSSSYGFLLSLLS